MKTVRMRQQSRYCGRSGECAPGDKIQLPDEEAEQLVDGNYADFVSGGQTETASTAPSETTSKPSPKPKKKTTRKKTAKKKSKKR